jgi:hypothetical protein
MWSLASPRVTHISGSKNFRSPPQKDFCNNICQDQTSVVSGDCLGMRLTHKQQRCRPAARGAAWSSTGVLGFGRSCSALAPIYKEYPCA